MLAGRANEVMAQIAAGADPETVILATSIGPLFVEMAAVLERALGIFERIGDRTGVMSTVIAMAYARYGMMLHFTSSARHLEEIRRVTSRLSELVTESERARLELQMLYGVQVFSRAKVVPDLALSRGEQAHREARLQGDRAIEFLAAGGVAMSLVDLGDIEGAERWLGQAATAAAAAPSRARALQLETWRGIVRARAGDAEGMRRHLERAVAMATEGGRASARCEVLARLAIEASRLAAAAPAGTTDQAAGGSIDLDPALVELAEQAAAQVEELLPLLPGSCAVGRAGFGGTRDAGPGPGRRAGSGGGRRCGARGAPGRASRGHQPRDHDPRLQGGARGRAARGPGLPPFVSPGDPVADRPGHGRRGRPRALAHGPGRARAGRARRTDGPRGPRPRRPSPAVRRATSGPSLDDDDRLLLQLLTEGHTNAEIASKLDVTEEEVARRLTRVQAQLGTTSRAGATSLAFRGLASVGSH